METDYRKHYGESKLLDNFYNRSVAEVLKEIRLEKGLSLTQVMKKSKMFTRQTLNKYELGGSKLRLIAFYELARIYNIEPKELFNKINYKYISNLSNYANELFNK